MQSIDKAVKNLQPGRLELSSGVLLGANINRSPTAYLYNRKIERDRFLHNVEVVMHLLKFTAAKGSK